jgi:hypothetical protein
MATVLRGLQGRNPGVSGGTTRLLLGRSVRVLAFGLAFMYSASRMIRRRQNYGGTGNTGTRSGERILDTAFGYWLPFFKRIRDDSGRHQTAQPIDMQCRDDC